MENKKVLIGGIIGVLAISSVIFLSYLYIIPEPATPELWLDNPTLDSPLGLSWFWNYGTGGDKSDMNYASSQDQAKIRVLGEKKTVRLIYGTPNSSTSPNWNITTNGDFMLPDDSEIRPYGAWVYHYLDESTGPGQVHNFPSVHFRKNISMPVDMSDYEIIDASLEVSFNASVNINVDTYWDWNQTTNTPYIDWDKFLIGDSANFYVQLSDMNYSYPFRVANFETRDVALGQGDLGNTTILNITDRELNYVNTQDLIAALNSALETDNQNLTITLGLDIYCEDNKGAGGGDQDLFNYLIFKSSNLTITYEKKIDYFTSISLNQRGNEVSGGNILVSQANFNFNYKINDTWPTSAPLSELRIFFNDILYDKATIKLSSANSSFQQAKAGGFDVKDLIDLNEDVNISIQLFLADNFNLDETIEISIDDIYLYLTITEVGASWTPVVIGLSAGIVSLGVAFGLYFKIFQFPTLVRKIRKLKNKIRKGRRSKSLLLSERQHVVEKIFQKKIQILNIEDLEKAKSIAGIGKEEVGKIVKIKIEENNSG